MFSFIKKFFKVTLHKSCEIGDIKAVRQHLADGADVNATHWHWSTTPLYEAAFGGHREIIELLIANGAMVNLVAARSGSTPLHKAAAGPGVASNRGYRGEVYYEIVKLLIANGAMVNWKDWGDKTPLHDALTKEIVELLIAAGADVNAKNKFGATPLDSAQCTFKFMEPRVIDAHKETADLLRKHGGKTGEELKAEGK